MANLNLSEFGENTSVSNADYTFVWDSANSISKKVSRNSWLNSGELTSSAPVTISQTWAGTGSTVFTAFLLDATTPGTTSAPSSLLFDLRVGGSTVANISKTGSGFFLGSVIANSNSAALRDGGVTIGNAGALQWSVSGTASATRDLFLVRDAPNTLALRNGAAAQTFNVYGTYTSGSVYERMFMRYNGTAVTFQVGVEQTGASNRSLEFLTAGVSRMIVGSSGNVGIGDPDLVTRFPATPLDVVKSTAINGPLLCLRSNLAGAVGNWLSIQFGDHTQNVGYRKGALIYEATTASVNGKFHIALNNDSSPNSATLADARLTVLPSGNVGIGTTAPSRLLSVVGNVIGANLMLLNNTNSAGYTELGFDNDTAFAGNLGGFVFGLSGTTTPTPNDAYFFNRRSAAIFFGTNSTERMRITAAGNVGIGTTSPTSKLHVVGDAVLTGQLLGGDYTVGTVATATQANVAITNNHTGQTNSSVVITPKGTGAFILGPKPDGTAVGGNARGNYAVDHQLDRTQNTDVASGPNSCIGGGQRNVASGAYAVVAGGQVGNASGSNSFIGSGLGNNAQAAQTVVVGGQSNTASVAFGFIVGGTQGLADRNGIYAHASGRFSATGDAQKTTAVFRNKTTTNAAVELFLDGASARYTVTSGKIISMLINITGTKSDGSAVAHYVRQYSIKNIGGTTSEVYAAITVGTDNAAGTSIALSADNTNDSLKIEVTGVASETWRWVASVDAVEVGHGV